MTDMPRVCSKCGGRGIHVYWTNTTRALCLYCSSKLSSVNSQVALAQGEALDQEQRDWIWEWFLKTKYFAYHRRMSRGRAKRLIQFMQSEANRIHNQRLDNAVLQMNGKFMGGGLNPANVLPRGPHDLVTDAALDSSPRGISPLGSPNHAGS